MPIRGREELNTENGNGERTYTLTITGKITGPLPVTTEKVREIIAELLQPNRPLPESERPTPAEMKETPSCPSPSCRVLLGKMEETTVAEQMSWSETSTMRRRRKRQPQNGKTGPRKIEADQEGLTQKSVIVKPDQLDGAAAEDKTLTQTSLTELVADN